MLCIERKPLADQDTIIVNHMGETLTIKLTLLEPKRMKLGFVGPTSFKIVRGEIEGRPSKAEKEAAEWEAFVAKVPQR